MGMTAGAVMPLHPWLTQQMCRWFQVAGSVGADEPCSELPTQGIELRQKGREVGQEHGALATRAGIEGDPAGTRVPRGMGVNAALVLGSFI